MSWRRLAVLAGATLSVAIPASAPAGASPVGPTPVEPVLDLRVNGDLRSVGNYVDPAGGVTTARLDLPAGATVIHARLYVGRGLGGSSDPAPVALAPPGSSRPTLIGQLDGARLIDDARVDIDAQRAIRQQTWDVTDLVRTHGGGEYGLASEAPPASAVGQVWALVVAFTGPAGTGEAGAFDARRITWYDGLRVDLDGRLDLVLDRLPVEPLGPEATSTVTLFAAQADPTATDTVFWQGVPLTAGAIRPVEPLCGSVADMVNGSICVPGGRATGTGAVFDLDTVQLSSSSWMGTRGPTIEVSAVGAPGTPIGFGVIGIATDLTPAGGR